LKSIQQFQKYQEKLSQILNLNKKIDTIIEKEDEDEDNTTIL
jgi:hypothetical protein